MKNGDQTNTGESEQNDKIRPLSPLFLQPWFVTLLALLILLIIILV